MSDIPRGIRNDNPGNIEKGDPWQGLARDQSADARFCVFKSPEWGIRAMCRILITYQDNYELDTVQDIIHRWAPPHENDTGSYVDQVASRIGVAADTSINVTRFDIMEPLVRAIILHENGEQPYRDSVIDRGLELAGIDVPGDAKARALDAERPLSRSRTVRGGKVAAAGGGAAVVSGMIGELGPALPVLRQIADFVQNQASVAVVVFGVLTLASAGYMLHARFDDRKQGKR